jgi:hypothetical protein
MVKARFLNKINIKNIKLTDSTCLTYLRLNEILFSDLESPPKP